MLPRRHTAVVLLTLSVMAGALLTAACDGGASESAANADVINAVNILETSGLHEMDEAVKKDGSISPDAKTTAEKLQTIVLLTEWPKDLQPQARALAALFAEMARVVEGDDKAKAGDAIKKAHDGYHDFTHGVWEHLYDEAGLTSGTASHGH